MPTPRNCFLCQRPKRSCRCAQDEVGDGDGFQSHAGFTGGHERPAHVAENTDEVLAMFATNPRPLVECAYCNTSIQTRDPLVAYAWFRNHACEGEGYQIEVAA